MFAVFFYAQLSIKLIKIMNRLRLKLLKLTRISWNIRKIKNLNCVTLTSLRTLRKILNFLCSEEYGFCCKEFSADFCTAVFFGYFVYLYPYSVSVGISDLNSSFLMSVSGICHFIARLLPLGHLVDKKVIKASTLSGAAFLICGIDIFFLPFTEAYARLMVLVAIFGATSGMGGSFIMVVVAYSAGSMEKAAAASSWMLLHCGVGNLVGIFGFGKFELPIQ